MESGAQAEQERGWRASWPHFRAGFLHAARLPMFVMLLTFLGVGSLAREAGASLGVALGATLLIWAGPAQVIFFGAIINGLSLPAIALSVSLSSVRLLPMCVSLLPWLRGRTLLRTLFHIHYVAVTGWAESIRRLPAMEPHARLPWFMGLVNGLYAAAIVSTVIGYWLAGAVPRPLAAGLIFVTPIYFAAAMLRNARETLDWAALGLGFALAPLVKAFVGGGVDLLVVGLVGGTAAWGAQRIVKARRA